MTPVSFQNQRVLELTSGPFTCRIAPEAGARLLTWHCGARPILHWPEPADWSQPAKIRGGNPILFPFIARHFVDGQPGRWKDPQGIIHDLPPHGFARSGTFRLIHADATSALTELITRHPGYPYQFAFRAKFHLDGPALEITLTTSNTGTTPLPCYPGHHFYFALPASERPHWTLTFPRPLARARQRPDGSIEDLGHFPKRCCLDDPALIDTFHLLDGTDHATLTHPDGRTLRFDLPALSTPWHAFTTWTEQPDSPFYCLEPWLGLPNAIHHSRGLRWIAPDTTETALCRLTATGW